MIISDTGDVLEPIEPVASTGRLEPLGSTAQDKAIKARRLVLFNDPDGAYLAAAALRRYLDAMVVRDVILVPTERGPALEIPADTATLRVLKAIVVRFGGRIGRSSSEGTLAPEI